MDNVIYNGEQKQRERVLDLHRKVEWLRRILSKICIKFDIYNRDKNYLMRVIWSFVCGYGIQDSFYYDFKTPKYIKRFIWWMKKYIII